MTVVAEKEKEPRTCEFLVPTFSSQQWQSFTTLSVATLLAAAASCNYDTPNIVLVEKKIFRPFIFKF